jgi:antirestriction protein ArdC
VLERDKTAIIHAAAKAEQAVTWLRCCSASEAAPLKIAA